MDIATFLSSTGSAASPVLFALLVAFAAGLIWMSFAPARPAQQVEERLQDYVDRGDVIEMTDMERSFFSRAVAPFFRRILRFAGRLMPQRGVAATERMLVQAGRSGNLTALDFMGLRVLATILLAVSFFLLSRDLSFTVAMRNGLIGALLGFFLPYMWLRRRVRLRQHEIERALPDALDMLTIGVEAGLAFESALVRVGDRWDNALTQEFRRAVAEMRVGTSRNAALQRMVERTGVPALRTFVAVLVQSSQLGISIAEVLHTQAAELRVRRRQRAEELARQASIKMLIPLVFLVFPALMVVILGPSIPAFIDLFRAMGAG